MEEKLSDNPLVRFQKLAQMKFNTVTLLYDCKNDPKRENEILDEIDEIEVRCEEAIAKVYETAPQN